MKARACRICPVTLISVVDKRHKKQKSVIFNDSFFLNSYNIKSFPILKTPLKSVIPV